MATSPAVSGVKERIIRERQISPEELAAERSGKMPDMWELIDTLAQKPQRWIDEDWWLAIVREDPKPSSYGGQNTLEQCQGAIDVRPGVSVALDDREQIELAIKQKYGGKAYRLMLKKGRQKISESKCINEAPPKYPEGGSGFPTPMPLPNAPQNDAAVAFKAMETVANQPQEVMNIAIGALRTAAELIGKNATTPAQANPPAQPSVADDLEREFKRAMITRMTADPIDSFIRMRDAIGGGNGTNSANTLLEKVLTAAVDKILNPVPAVTGRTTLLDLGREFIPVLGTTVRETMHEYRLSREADARIAETMRGMPGHAQPAGPASMPQVPAPIDVTPQSAPAPNPPPPAETPAQHAAPMLTFPQIAHVVANIVKNVEYSTDEAVEHVLSFFYNTDARLAALLLNPPSLDPRLPPGKPGLIMLFENEPSLKACMSNVPRVSEFIDKFIVAATEAEAAEARLRAAAPQPTATAPA